MPALPLLLPLIRELRTAHRDGRAADVLRESLARLLEDEEYRVALRADVRTLLQETTSTHLFTEVGILSDEPLVSGFVRRLGRRVAPAPPRAAVLEGLLGDLMEPGDAAVLVALEADVVEGWLEALVKDATAWDDPSQLASALVILGTRVAGAGLDPRLCERMPRLEEWNSPFLQLSRDIDRFAEAYVRGTHLDLVAPTREVLQRCVDRVVQFRAEKEQLGTTLHLSSASLRMLQQLRRLDLLVGCTVPVERPHALLALAIELGTELDRGDPAGAFVRQKMDLIAYLVVGHAAQKGDKYAARSRRDYLGFVYKSLFGGLLVAVFAMVKLHLSSDLLAPIPQALVYGLNYAVCFALIYLLGATLATKQPALTASRIADALEGAPGHETFPELVRAIFRSQFISFVGNVVGAAGVALLLAMLYTSLTDAPFIDAAKAEKLAATMHPLTSGTVFYAGVAGVLLSAAGFVSAFVDNAVVFHRLADRVAAGRGVFGWLGEGARRYLSKRVEKHAGGVTGNVVLGFLLGSAGTFGMMWGIPFDIRHIAFSSSHGALALLAAPDLRTVGGVLAIGTAVVLIGLVNFLVSFGLTLVVAIDARRLDGADWRRSLREVWALLRERPLSFVVPTR